MTVRLQGTVVSEEIYGFGRWRIRLGRSVPTASGARFATARWLDRGAVEIAPTEGPPRRLAVGETERWERPNGVSVDIGLVPAEQLPVRVASSGDLTFLLTFAMLSALVAQLAFLVAVFFPASGGPDQNAGTQPTPELIARLLQQDFDGAEAGIPEETVRPDLEEPGSSYYLPSGNKGPLDRDRGGKKQGPEVVRTDPTDEEAEPSKKPIADSPETKDSTTATETETAAADAPPEPQAPQDPQPTKLPPQRVVPADPVERFIGWGFRDWMDRGAAKQVDPDLERTLTVARVRLRIDPDDQYALQVVGYYAYLAEEMELSQAMYQRYVTLYGDDPAGYNNLALTYKRLGEYDEEEALYRRALELDPLDDHVLNNLAVNLAHQGRGDEALQIMDQLQVLTPDDPYADLHRAKIYATMGKRDKAYKYLKQALQHTALLDTLHHIEFRQDIRVDPAFQTLRHESKFQELILKFYGDEAKQILDNRWRPSATPGLGEAGG